MDEIIARVATATVMAKSDQFSSVDPAAPIKRTWAKVVLPVLVLAGLYLVPLLVYKVVLKSHDEKLVLAPTKEPISSHANAANAKRLVREFLATETIDDRASFIRHRGKTLLRMREFHSGKPIKPRTVEKFFSKMGIEKIDGVDFFWLHVQLDDLSVQMAAFEITPDGLKLDWE